MTAARNLVELMRDTARAVRQQEELGIDAAFLPDGLPELAVEPEVATAATDSVPDSLDQLYKQKHQCTLCSLGHKRRHFVFGSGNPNADLMFVGEAPGADEDAKGQPFVGVAGQLLAKILEAIKFDRDEVYIANILKCRPPNNRDPEPGEIESCEPILREQIRLISPKLICALGRVSAQALLRTSASLGRLRGQFHDYNGVPLLVTYHPSALLRNPAFKRHTWEDVQMLRTEYDRLAGTVGA